VLIASTAVFVAAELVSNVGTADWFDAITTGSLFAIVAWPLEFLLLYAIY
jgi:hypothetical protein